MNTICDDCKYHTSLHNDEGGEDSVIIGGAEWNCTCDHDEACKLSNKYQTNFHLESDCHHGSGNKSIEIECPYKEI